MYSGLGVEGEVVIEEEEEDFSTEEIVQSDCVELEQIKEGEVRVVELPDTDNENENENDNNGAQDSNSRNIDSGHDIQSSSVDTSIPEHTGFKAVSPSSLENVININIIAEESAGDKKSNDDDATKDLAKQIKRAECIAESLADIKIFPLFGGPSILDKPKYENLFDGIFVSARSAQCLEMPSFKKLLKSREKVCSDTDNVPANADNLDMKLGHNQDQSLHGSVVAVETSKFLVPLSKKVQSEFNKKIEEYATVHGWSSVSPSPVFRRRRDELDTEDDVIFFKN